jgi:hypothetical protein
MLGQHRRVFKLVPYQSVWIDHFNRELIAFGPLLEIRLFK